MSDDRGRNRDGGRGDDDDLGLFRGFGANDENKVEPETVQMPEGPEAESPPPLDEETVAAHRAARRERQRKRREAQAKNGGGGNPNGPGPGRGGKGSALPALRPDLKPDTPALRAERVEAIRRDLVRRRRRKGGGMLFKLWLFVALPTCLVAWFLWYKASDLYQSQSSFNIQIASPTAGGSAGALGGLFGGAIAGAQESVAVQNFITSRDALARLDEQYGIIAHYRDPAIDWFHRDRGNTFEDAFTHYKKMVQVSYDPTEGQLEMSLIAADAESARLFSKALIRYSEQMVDQLQDRMRVAALSDAEKNLKAAETRLEEAQLAAAEIRKQVETFSVEGEVSAEMSLIASLEAERERLKTRLATLRRITSEEDPRIAQLNTQIASLTEQIEDRRINVTGNDDGDGDKRSLADINAELERANFSVQSAKAIFASAIEAMEVARKEAARQHRYLAVISQPSLPDRANYPKKLEMTALAFLCFLGIYIVGSLTISLIREQASI